MRLGADASGAETPVLTLPDGGITAQCQEFPYVALVLKLYDTSHDTFYGVVDRNSVGTVLLSEVNSAFSFFEVSGATSGDFGQGSVIVTTGDGVWTFTFAATSGYFNDETCTLVGSVTRSDFGH